MYKSVPVFVAGGSKMTNESWTNALSYLLLHSVDFTIMLFRGAFQSEGEPISDVIVDLVQEGRRQQEEANKHPAVVHYHMLY